MWAFMKDCYSHSVNDKAPNGEKATLDILLHGSPAACEAHLKEDLFVSSTVVHFSDSTTVFLQGPMVKRLALSKECFSSSSLKSVFICVP